jgi:hypothetical protein
LLLASCFLLLASCFLLFAIRDCAVAVGLSKVVHQSRAEWAKVGVVNVNVNVNVNNNVKSKIEEHMQKGK